MKLTTNTIITAFFLFAEAVLYWFILTAGGMTVVVCSYTAIVLCFLYALVYVRRCSLLFVAALACTLGADYYLVIADPQQQLGGMICFLFVQGFYGWQLHRTYKRKWPLYLRLGLTAVAATVCFLVLGEDTDVLAVVSVCYYANLICNILLSWLQFSNYKLAAIGFIFFLLCDTVIGLQVASTGYLEIEPGSWLHSIIFPPFHLSWFFYLPSQVLLSLSSRKL